MVTGVNFLEKTFDAVAFKRKGMMNRASGHGSTVYLTVGAETSDDNETCVWSGG